MREMIRAISVPEQAHTWDDVVESFVYALFRSVARDHYVWIEDRELVMVKIPPGCVRVPDVASA